MPRKNSAYKNLLARANCLLSRSGQWGQGIDEGRVKEFATEIEKCECLPGTMLQTGIPLGLARYLAWIELEEKFHREWLAVKKLLRKRREKLWARIKAKGKARLPNSLKTELAEIDKRLGWMRLGPRSPGGTTGPGTKPFLHARWNALWQMDQLLISEYRGAVIRGMRRRFERLASERINNPRAPIPDWASLENFQRITKKEMNRKERAQILACVMGLSSYTTMSAASILRGLQRHYPTS